MFIQVNSLTLHVQLEGPAQRPALVLIHSLGCDLHSWDSVVEKLWKHYRILRYDLRGHGLSEAPPGPYTLRGHTTDLLALLEHDRLEKAIFAGTSLGGLIAIDLAIWKPGAVRGLVLSDTAPRISTPEVWEERIRAVRELGLARMADNITARWFSPAFQKAHPAVVQAYQDILARTSPEGYTASCAALRDTDLSEALPSIKAPALVLVGAEDQVVTPDQTRQWASCLPAARLDVVPGAAHLPCVEQPEWMAARMAEFIRKERHAR